MATVNDGMHIEVTASSIGAKEAFEETRQSLETIAAAVLSLGNDMDALRRKMENPVKISWGEELASGMDKAGGYIERGFAKIVKGLTVTATAIGGTIAAVTKSALDVGGGFETQMTRVKIISGATADDLAALTQKAREMGESLPITAQEAASAMELLAQRGTQAKDILASVADVSALAISQNVGMAEASELLGSTMTNFGIAIEKASQVTDIFNNASNQSALNISKLAEGLKYVGPAASAAGMKLEEAVAAMEVLANAGLSGEMIGTGLSMTLSKIAASSSILGVKTKELDGTMRPLKDIFVELQARGLSLSDASKVFGERAAKAALNLAKHSGALQENERNLQKWGSTQKAVTEQLGTFENVFKGLESAIEGVRLEIFDQIKDESKEAVGGVTELTRTFRAWIGETQIASKTLKGFLSGLGVNIPSGDEFKKLLASFDVAEFVQRIKGFGATLKEIGAAFGALVNAVKGPLTFLVKHIDTFAQLSFWGWILGKGMQIPQALLTLGGAFKKLKDSIGGIGGGALVSIQGSLGKVGDTAKLVWGILNTPLNAQSLAPFVQGLRGMWDWLVKIAAFSWTGFMKGCAAAFAALASLDSKVVAFFALIKNVGVWEVLKNAAIAALTVIRTGVLSVNASMGALGILLTGAVYLAEKLKGAKQEEIAALEREAQVADQLADYEAMDKAITLIKTGYEDITALAEQFGIKEEKAIETMKRRADTVKGGNISLINTAVEQYNKSLGNVEAHLKVSEDDVKAWGERIIEAVNGNARAMEALEPKYQAIVKLIQALKSGAVDFAKTQSMSFEEAARAYEESLKKQKQAQEEEKKAQKASFSSSINATLDGIYRTWSEKIEKAVNLIGDKNIDVAVNANLEQAKKQLEDFIKETAESFNIPEDVVKRGVIDKLKSLGDSAKRNSLSAALIEGLEGAKDKVGDFLDNARDAVEYLGESPAKFLPAIQSMVNGLSKVDTVTGKVSEAFKKGQKALKDFADMTFDKLKGRIQQIKDAVEGGFVDRKALEAEFKGAFEKAQLKVTAELLPKRGEYQDPKVFSGVLMSEIRKEMESIGGKDYGDKAAEELRKIGERFSGDVARALEEQKRLTERRAKYDFNPQAQQQTRAVAEQRPTEQDKTQALVQGITNSIGPFMSKLESSQSVQAVASQSLANAIAPVNAAIQNLAAKLGLMQGAVTTNTTALTGVAGAIEKIMNIGGPSQKSAPSIHIEINQNGFIIQKRDDAGLVANLVAGALRTGLGNAM